MKNRQKRPVSFFQKQKKSFQYAFHGIIFMFRNESRFLIHIFILLCVILSGIILQISSNEWIWIVIVSGMVLASETFNSAIEQLTNLIHPQYAIRAGLVKDLAAGAVLFSAITAAITGVFIFAPKIFIIVMRYLP